MNARAPSVSPGLRDQAVLELYEGAVLRLARVGGMDEQEHVTVLGPALAVPPAPDLGGRVDLRPGRGIAEERKDVLLRGAGPDLAERALADVLTGNTPIAVGADDGAAGERKGEERKEGR